MDIIVKGRHTGVNDKFRDHAATKLAKFEKLDQKVIRVDVEVSRERNPRIVERRERVEITIVSRGPAVRAEAAAGDRFVALDAALDKLDTRIRRLGERRKDARKGKGPKVADRAAPAAPVPPAAPSGAPSRSAAADAGADDHERRARRPDGYGDRVVAIDMDGDGPLVVREKTHRSRPMTIEQALFEMELVGHDFYLFRDGEDGMPSVVYRRRGYDYGVIRLAEG